MKSKKKIIIFSIIVTLILLIITFIVIIKNKKLKIEDVELILSSYENYIGDIKNMEFDENYNNNYRFVQKFKDIEVYGGGIVATINKNEVLSIINYNYTIPENFDVTPENNKDDLLNVARGYLNNIEVEPIESKLIIFPIDEINFTLAYLFKFNEGNIIVSDSDKTILGTTSVFSEASSTNTILKDENIKEKLDEVLYNKNYEDLVKNGLDIKENEINEFLKETGKFVLEDNKRNFKFYSIKNEYDVLSDVETMRNDTKYYEEIQFSSIEEANFEDNYYSIKGMQNLQKTYDFYKKMFNHNSFKGNQRYLLKVLINLNKIKETGKKTPTNYSDNAMLVYFDDEVVMIYVGEEELENMDIEGYAHEYTHAYFNRITQCEGEKETKSINESYSDIMSMIIEAYYLNNNSIDGIYAEGERVGIERKIKDSTLTYKKYDDSLDYHELSMIVSKAAYLMSINEELDLSIEEMAQIWFNSLYKLPKHYIDYEDVERAVLLQAKELGYSNEKGRIIADIFVSLEYPDLFEECYNNKKVTLNIRDVKKLSKDDAIKIVKNHFGDKWKDASLQYEYIGTVTNKNNTTMYAINTYSDMNFMYLGGEWIQEIADGKFYAGTYYVSSSYSYNKVYVGHNLRDYGENENGEKIKFFLEDYYIDLNELNNSQKASVENKDNQKEIKEEQTNVVVDNKNIVGTWRAVNTNNSEYSLMMLYGSSISLGNELIIRDDGTYSLGLGVTYWQEGSYEIKENKILLKNNIYNGDNPDKIIAKELYIENDTIILKDSSSGVIVDVIFNKENKLDLGKEEAASDLLRIGNKDIKFGKYEGIDAATGDILIINKDKTATLNGEKYDYIIDKHDFSQDPSTASILDAIVFKNSSGQTAFALYVSDSGCLCLDPMTFKYIGN